jgi:hypothetical protein
MQQALYNHIGISHPAAATGTTQRKTTGVLALIGSSAAYSVFALTHLGL